MLAWLTRSILGQQNESTRGASSNLERTHPRETYPGGATGNQQKTSSTPFPTMCAALVNCTGFAAISESSALKSIPSAGGSNLTIEEELKGYNICIKNRPFTVANTERM